MHQKELETTMETPLTEIGTSDHSSLLYCVILEFGLLHPTACTRLIPPSFPHQHSCPAQQGPLCAWKHKNKGTFSDVTEEGSASSIGYNSSCPLDYELVGLSE